MEGGERRGAAFFDLDKTLMEGSSAFQFARAAYRAGMLRRREILRDVRSDVTFRLRGATDEESDALRGRVLDAIAGTRVRDLERLAPQVLAGILPRVYPQMLEVAYEHQEAGRPAYIVTAASHELAEMLAHVLRFNGGVGTRSQIKQGVYTGEPDGPFVYRDGKVEAMKLLAAECGIDLAESYAYSDSASDLPMMRAVGHPVAVNPDSELESVARQEGWQIMRFDKLARRLRVLAGAAAVAVIGGGGGYVAARARDGRRGRWRH